MRRPGKPEEPFSRDSELAENKRQGFCACCLGVSSWRRLFCVSDHHGIPVEKRRLGCAIAQVIRRVVGRDSPISGIVRRRCAGISIDIHRASRLGVQVEIPDYSRSRLLVGVYGIAGLRIGVGLSKPAGCEVQGFPEIIRVWQKSSINDYAAFWRATPAPQPSISALLG